MLDRMKEGIVGVVLEELEYAMEESRDGCA